MQDLFHRLKTAVADRYAIERLTKPIALLSATALLLQCEAIDRGGTLHLTVELDSTGGAFANPDEVINRVITVIRSRVDEFGVRNALIESAGNERIIVELPGIDDPVRAKAIIVRRGLLEFQITDMQRQFEASLERIDRALERAGVVVGDEAETRGAARTAIQQILGAATDTTIQSTDSAGTTDSLDVEADAPVTAIFSRFLNQGQLPGEFLVAEEDVPRVTQLIEHPEFQRNMPRGFVLRWGREPMSIVGRRWR